MIDNYECCSGMVEINPAEDIHRWSVQQTITILANADYYYTKNEMDIILKRIEGKILSEEQIRAIIDQCTQEFITEAEVDAKLEDYSTKEETEAAIEEAIEHISLDDYYTKEETDEAIEDAIEHISLDDYYTKQETNAAITAATQPLETEIANKADLSALTTHTSDSSIHVTVADKNAWNAKLDASDVEGFFGAVGYDSQTKRINFYNETTGGTVLAYIDATDFIKDGMVSNVEIKTVSGETSLVISFNTDAGKEDIVIPISEIFDASNYYTKTEVDGALSSITSDVASVSGNVNTISGDVSTLSGQVQTNEATLTAHTANTTVHVTAQDKTTWNNKSDFSGDYNDLTNKPTNVSDFTNDAGYVTQTDIDESISGKADTSAVTASIAALDEKKLDASAYTPTDLSNYYTKSETSGATEISTALASKADASDLTALSGEVATNEEVTSRALNTLNNALSGKADTNSVYTKAEVDSALSGKQDTLNIVQTTGSSSADVMSQSAVTYGLNDKLSNVDFFETNFAGTGTTGLRKSRDNSTYGAYAFVASINQKPILSSSYLYVNQFSLVETSAITTSVTSASTDSQVPSAKAVQTALSLKADASDLTALSGEVATNEEVTSRALNVLNTNMGGLKLMQISQADYEALTTKDASTLYIILETN